MTVSSYVFTHVVMSMLNVSPMFFHVLTVSPMHFHFVGKKLCSCLTLILGGCWTGDVLVGKWARGWGGGVLSG